MKTYKIKDNLPKKFKTALRTIFGELMFDSEINDNQNDLQKFFELGFKQIIEEIENEENKTNTTDETDNQEVVDETSNENSNESNETVDSKEDKKRSYKKRK